MRTAIDIINEKFPDATIIVKDIGNRGYYIKTYYGYNFITKRQIIRHMTMYETNERKKKLISLQIMGE